MRKALPLVVALIAAAGLIAACGGSDAPKPTLSSGDVAVVGADKVTQKQFDQLYASAVAQGTANGQPAPKKGSAEEKTLRQQVLQVLVQNAIIAQEADAKGVKVDEKKVASDIKAFELQCCQAKKAKVDAYLKTQGLTADQLHDQFVVRQQAQGLYNKLTKDVKVTDDEARKQYEKDKKAMYTTARSRKVAHILIDVAPKGKSTAADCAKAEEVLALVKASPGKWKALVKKYSADPGSKNTGGVYTITDDENWDADFRKASFALQNTGDITDPPVKSQFGCHIIKALGPIIAATEKPFDSVKAQIVTQLEQQKKNDVATKWFDGVQKEYEAKSVYAKGYSLPPKAKTSSTSTG